MQRLTIRSMWRTALLSSHKPVQAPLLYPELQSTTKHARLLEDLLEHQYGLRCARCLIDGHYNVIASCASFLSPLAVRIEEGGRSALTKVNAKTLWDDAKKEQAERLDIVTLYGYA